MVERRRAASRVPCSRIGSDGRVHRDAALHCPSAAELPIPCRRFRTRLDRLGVTNPAAHAGLLVSKHSSMTPAADDCNSSDYQFRSRKIIKPAEGQVASAETK